MPGTAPLGDILTRTLDNLDLAAKAQKYAVFSVWRKVVGDVSRYARPRRIQGDVLYVATASSVWSQELTFMGKGILFKLNEMLGGQYIREIRFSEHLWSSQEDDAPQASQRRGGGAEAGPAADAQWAGVTQDEIGDPALRRAFRRVAVSMVKRRQGLVASGYKVCRTCGCIYPADRAGCPACRLDGESRAYARAIAILDGQPETPAEDLMRLSGLVEAGLAERARREVESRLISAIRHHLASATRDNVPVSRLSAAARAELVPAICKLASLRSLQPAETMSRDDLVKAVGRRMASVVKKE